MEGRVSSLDGRKTIVSRTNTSNHLCPQDPSAKNPKKGTCLMFARSFVFCRMLLEMLPPFLLQQTQGREDRHYWQCFSDKDILASDELC